MIFSLNYVQARVLMYYSSISEHLYVFLKKKTKWMHN